MKSDKLKKIILNCYEELYQNSTPKGNFKELLANAELNERGEKVIPFDDYRLDRDIYESIVDKYIKKYKMNAYTQKVFNFQMYLGCGPKFK